MGQNIFAQGFPVVLQWFFTELVDFFLVAVDRQDTLSIGSVAERFTGTLFFGQIVGCFQQPVLHGFKSAVSQAVGTAIGIFHTVFRQIVGIVDHAHTQSAAAQAGAFGGRNRVVLIAQQAVEGTYDQISQFFQLIQIVQCSEVKCGQSTERDFTGIIVHVFQRLGWQRNFQTQVGLTHRSQFRIERAVGITVVNVLNVDTAGAGAFLHHAGEQVDRFQCFLTDTVLLLVFNVELLKQFLIFEEGVIQARNIGW